MTYRNNPSTYLWNPATKHSKLIPPHFIRSNIMSFAIGFGFDPIGNDLKVLRVVYSLDMSLSAEVCSANTNVWRKVDPRPTSYPQYEGFDVCVNGFMCCVGSWGMIAFDLDKEVFTCDIQIPEGSLDYCITDFNDSIAIITSKEEELNNIFKLWTLNDETCLHGGGVEASWTLMFMVDVDFPHRHVFGCLNSGDFLLFTDDDVCLLYDSRKKVARNIPFSIFMGKRNIIKYNESLVTIIGSKQVDWNALEQDC